MKRVIFLKKRSKPTSFNVFLMLLAVFGLSLSMQAQVTIGTIEKSVEGSLLQLKEKDQVTDDSYNAYKGLALPRVELSKKNQLFPMFLTDPDNPNSGANADYAANKPNIDKSHTGLIVYNLTKNEEEDLNHGLYRWNGEEWISSDNKMGSAKFDPVNCSDIKVNGVYIEGTSATSENYLSITLNVIKAGTFTIMATTENGYGFYLSGVALKAGEKIIVNVPCQGTPSVVRIDQLTFSGIEVNCVKEVEVLSATAEYSLNCSSIKVNGQYVKGQTLKNTNTITLRVRVSKAGSYSIVTPRTNGILFYSSGNLSVGTQSITLSGIGIPTVNDDFHITINANSAEGNITCSTTIPMTLPAMTYAIIGNDLWSWNRSERKKAITTGASFGPQGTVKIVSFSELWSETSVGAAVNRLNNPKKPDIILYFAYNATPSAALIQALINYINDGGCVIYGHASGGSGLSDTRALIEGIFPGFGTIDNVETQPINKDDCIYHIMNLPYDPIINGPFGNLSSRYWGEDNESIGTARVNALPPNSVQICSAVNSTFPDLNTIKPEYSVLWYNDSKNFVYFGDCTGVSTNNTSPREFPTIYNSAGVPQSKYYGHPVQFVYNSALELNAIAWAIKKAAVSGINPH